MTFRNIGKDALSAATLTFRDKKGRRKTTIYDYNKSLVGVTALELYAWLPGH